MYIILNNVKWASQEFKQGAAPPPPTTTTTKNAKKYTFTCIYFVSGGILYLILYEYIINTLHSFICLCF